MAEEKKTAAKPAAKKTTAAQAKAPSKTVQRVKKQQPQQSIKEDFVMVQHFQQYL